MVGLLVSFWDGIFSGVVLNFQIFQGVIFHQPKCSDHSWTFVPHLHHIPEGNLTGFVDAKVPPQITTFCTNCARMSIGHSSRVRTTALQQDDGSLFKDQEKWHENHGRYPPNKLTWQWTYCFNRKYIYSWWLFMDVPFLYMLVYWRVSNVTIVNDSYVITIPWGVSCPP